MHLLAAFGGDHVILLQRLNVKRASCLIIGHYKGNMSEEHCSAAAGAAAASNSRQYATDLQTDVAHIGTSLTNAGLRAGPGGRSSVWSKCLRS